MLPINRTTDIQNSNSILDSIDARVQRSCLLRGIGDENIKVEGCWPLHSGMRDHRTLLVLTLAPGPWQ